MPPRCKECKKEMKPFHKIASGLDEILEVILDAISTGGNSIFYPSKFGCKNKIDNPKYEEYWKEKEEEEKRKRRGVVGKIQSIGKKKLPDVPPPKKIPCPNHHTLQVEGEWKNKITKRKKQKPVFNKDGNPIISMW